MDTAVIAQLVTGIATLIIGTVLVFQLRKQNQQIEIQNRQLELQHQDSERELAFSARARGEELTLSRLTNDSLLEAYMKVAKGDDTASDIEIHTKEILSIKKKLNEILASHSGQKVDKIVKDSDRDNFMSPEEAVKYGLIDSVVDSRSIKK